MITERYDDALITLQSLWKKLHSTNYCIVDIPVLQESIYRFNGVVMSMG
jgi:hypothetical protein